MSRRTQAGARALFVVIGGAVVASCTALTLVTTVRKRQPAWKVAGGRGKVAWLTRELDLRDHRQRRASHVSSESRVQELGAFAFAELAHVVHGGPFATDVCAERRVRDLEES